MKSTSPGSNPPSVAFSQVQDPIQTSVLAYRLTLTRLLTGRSLAAIACVSNRLLILCLCAIASTLASRTHPWEVRVSYEPEVSSSEVADSRQEHRGPVREFSAVLLAHVQCIADCCLHEHLARLAQTQSPARPQQVDGLVILNKYFVPDLNKSLTGN